MLRFTGRFTLVDARCDAADAKQTPSRRPADAQQTLGRSLEPEVAFEVALQWIMLPAWLVEEWGGVGGGGWGERHVTVSWNFFFPGFWLVAEGLLRVSPPGMNKEPSMTVIYDATGRNQSTNEFLFSTLTNVPLLLLPPPPPPPPPLSFLRPLVRLLGSILRAQLSPRTTIINPSINNPKPGWFWWFQTWSRSIYFKWSKRGRNLRLIHPLPAEWTLNINQTKGRAGAFGWIQLNRSCSFISVTHRIQRIKLTSSSPSLGNAPVSLRFRSGLTLVSFWPTTSANRLMKSIKLVDWIEMKAGFFLSSSLSFSLSLFLSFSLSLFLWYYLLLLSVFVGGAGGRYGDNGATCRSNKFHPSRETPAPKQPAGNRTGDNGHPVVSCLTSAISAPSDRNPSNRPLRPVEARGPSKPGARRSEPSMGQIVESGYCNAPLTIKRWESTGIHCTQPPTSVPEIDIPQLLVPLLLLLLHLHE